MKRLLLVASVFVFVPVAWGAGHKTAQLPTAVSPLAVRTAPVGAIAARRKRKAGREAEQLLRGIVLPPGAARLSQRKGNGVLSTANVGGNIFTQYEYRHAFWQVRESVVSVEAFFKRHRTPGFMLGASGGQPVSIGFDGKPVGGRVGQEHLLVTLAPFAGSTVIRVDAGAAWTYPRSPREVVPAAVREIDIRSLPLQPALRRAGARRVSRRVTD